MSPIGNKIKDVNSFKNQSIYTLTIGIAKRTLFQILIRCSHSIVLVWSVSSTSWSKEVSKMLLNKMEI